MKTFLRDEWQFLKRNPEMIFVLGLFFFLFTKTAIEICS